MLRRIQRRHRRVVLHCLYPGAGEALPEFLFQFPAMGLKCCYDVLDAVGRDAAHIPVEAALVSDDVGRYAAVDDAGVQGSVVGPEAVVNAAGGDEGLHFLFQPGDELSRHVNGAHLLLDAAAVACGAVYGSFQHADALLAHNGLHARGLADDGVFRIFGVEVFDGLNQSRRGYAPDLLVVRKGEIDRAFQAGIFEKVNRGQAAG